MDRIDAMKVFVQVAETGSFSRTADTLAMPRTSISAAIQQLEREWSTRLFHRTPRRVALSRDGVRALRRCRQILAELAALPGQLNTEPPLQGLLHIGAPGHFTRDILLPALPAFLARYPAVNLNLLSLDPPSSCRMEAIDGCIQLEPTPSPDWGAIPLGSLDMVHCASPDYLTRCGTPQTPEDLARHQVITCHGRPTDHPMRIGVDRREHLSACALAGMGLIQVPLAEVVEPLARGELVCVLTDWRPVPMPVWMCYPQHTGMTPMLQALTGWLQTVLSNPGSLTKDIGYPID